MKLTILIPCFNEQDTILRVIQEAKGINADKEIIVIDNFSTDATRQILRGLDADDTLRLVFHSKNEGVGYSVKEGIRLARGEYLHVQGADMEYEITDVYKMMDKMEGEGLDAVFGSRLMGATPPSWTALIRERPFWLGTIIATALINLLYGRRFTDVIATKLLKTEIVRNLGCAANGQALEFELASRLCKMRCRIGEVPVRYRPRSRREGKKIKARDIIPAIAAILKVKFLGRTN